MSSKSVTLTTKQQTQTLASKKKNIKKKAKYVMADPFPRYWPQLDDEQSEHLCKLLKTVQSENPEWFAGKTSSDESRPIHYGLQASVRKLETGQMKLLVLSADLKPRFVANQIILLALGVNHETRIVCVPNLDILMQPLLKFSCYAFVISEESWSRFPDLDKWTADLVEKHFPVSEVIDAYFSEPKYKTTSCSMEMDGSDEHTSRRAEEKIDFDSIYLTRDESKPNQRAFVPKNAINLKPIALEIESLNKVKSDYISLDTFDASSGPSSSQNNICEKDVGSKLKKKRKPPLVLYRPLTLEKVQSNPNKVKKIRNKKNKNKNINNKK